MAQTIEELMKKRRKWIEANRENGFDAGIKRLLTDLYPDNAHFIYELLQNAEDAHAEKVRFILNEDCIEFEHNGKKLFSIQDVDAITSIGFSTKRDEATNIGKFGIGFKAVFAYTDMPEIASGEFNFRIRDIVVPERNDLSERVSMSRQTRFVLPFNNPRKPSKQAVSEIKKLLNALDVTSLLFLAHIRKIEYLLPDTSLGYIERIEWGDNRFEIRVQKPCESDPLSTWFLKFDKKVQVKDEEAEPKKEMVKTCRIAVAFRMSQVKTETDITQKKDTDVRAKSRWKLVPIRPGNVCIYFPADKETSNLRFHLHAPFASTVARDSVRDCVGNNALRDHIADLLAESMHEIRDQGLLTVHGLALLPNDKDNLSEFYKPIMDRLVKEFNEQNLVPMKRGGHAAATGAFRGQRRLSDLIDDDDLVSLLGDGYSTPIWVANPTQRNQQEDNFLSMLDIKEWTDEDLASALLGMDDNARIDWMHGKDEMWHQKLYAYLEDQAYGLEKSKIVRISDGAYRMGSECFFPTEEIEDDAKFPRVAKGVYVSGKKENKKARDFLEMVGVRKVDEAVEIEAILNAYYTYNATSPNKKEHYGHLRRFIRFIESNPHQDQKDLFEDFCLFMVDEKWVKPTMVYLDAPFMNTGLSFYYDAIRTKGGKHPLSDAYKKSRIKPEKIGEFAKRLGASTRLPIEKTEISANHPEWNFLSRHGGKRWRGCRSNEDYHIPHLADFLASPSISKSRLIWLTMKDSCSICDWYACRYLQARFGRNASNIVAAKSTLIHDLMSAEWIPQKNGKKVEFVQSRDAIAEKLPEGFEYQTGWNWLKAIEFGERKEAQRWKRELQTAEYKQREKVAKDLGFESPEKAKEMARLLKEKPDEIRRLMEQNSVLKEKPAFPTKTSTNPDRRQERVAEQMNEAPEKEYEQRNRSVRTTREEIDPILWLRDQYTNDAGQMICQICEEEMPFRKRDGEYYFEAVEALSRDYFAREHEAQYLALCPLCAAMYNEFVKRDEGAMKSLKNALINSEDAEVPLQPGELASVRFTERHFLDMRTIIEAQE